MEELQNPFREIRFEIRSLVQKTSSEQGKPVIHFISLGGKKNNPQEKDPEKKTTKTIRHLGIFPSSFNPLTVAHIELTRKAMEKFDLKEVVLMLDAQAIDKEIHGASLEDRLLMLALFARSYPGYRIAFSSHGRFLDKLKALYRTCPTVQEFCFIVGYDTIVRVLDPQYYNNRKKSLEELFQKSRFLVANRAYDGPAELRALFGKPGNESFKDRVEFFSLPASRAHLSSTLAREKISRGEDIEDLVPPVIHQFIREARLYVQAEK